jgi:hypothetical protein
MICNESLSYQRYEPMISGLLDTGRDILNFELGAQFGNYRNIGNNAKTKDCGNYRGQGESALIEDLEASYTQGFGCLESLYQAFRNVEDESVRAQAYRLRRIARRVMGNFVNGANKMFTFECNDPLPEPGGVSRTVIRAADPENHISAGTHAFASTCEGYFGGESIVPGIQLNNNYFNTASDNDRRSTLFHELLHHAGIYHDSEEGRIDLVYKLQFCCFGFSDGVIPTFEEIPTSFTCADTLAADHGDLPPTSKRSLEVRSMAQ